MFIYGMCLLFLDGFGGGVGGLFLSSFAMGEEQVVIRKFLVSTYSYEVLTILVEVLEQVVVLRVIVPFGLRAPPNENELVFQSKL